MCQVIRFAQWRKRAKVSANWERFLFLVVGVEVIRPLHYSGMASLFFSKALLNASSIKIEWTRADECYVAAYLAVSVLQAQQRAYPTVQLTPRPPKNTHTTLVSELFEIILKSYYVTHKMTSASWQLTTPETHRRLSTSVLRLAFWDRLV